MLGTRVVKPNLIPKKSSLLKPYTTETNDVSLFINGEFPKEMDKYPGFLKLINLFLETIEKPKIGGSKKRNTNTNKNSKVRKNSKSRKNIQTGGNNKLMLLITILYILNFVMSAPGRLNAFEKKFDEGKISDIFKLMYDKAGNDFISKITTSGVISEDIATAAAQRGKTMGYKRKPIRILMRDSVIKTNKLSKKILNEITVKTPDLKLPGSVYKLFEEHPVEAFGLFKNFADSKSFEVMKSEALISSDKKLPLLRISDASNFISAYDKSTVVVPHEKEVKDLNSLVVGEFQKYLEYISNSPPEEYKQDAYFGNMFDEEENTPKPFLENLTLAIWTSVVAIVFGTIGYFKGKVADKLVVPEPVSVPEPVYVPEPVSIKMKVPTWGTRLINDKHTEATALEAVKSESTAKSIWEKAREAEAEKEKELEKKLEINRKIALDTAKFIRAQSPLRTRKLGL